MKKISGISKSSKCGRKKFRTIFLPFTKVGKGAVRDVIEQVIKVQGTWIDDDTPQVYLEWSSRIESKK